MPPPASDWFVYIVTCADGSYYVGHTHDIQERIALHNSGNGALWTSLRRPLTLAFWERSTSEVAAIRRERQLKKWSRAKKEALIVGDLDRLMSLSKSHPRLRRDDAVV